MRPRYQEASSSSVFDVMQSCLFCLGRQTYCTFRYHLPTTVAIDKRASGGRIHFSVSDPVDDSTVGSYYYKKKNRFQVSGLMGTYLPAKTLQVDLMCLKR